MQDHPAGSLYSVLTTLPRPLLCVEDPFKYYLPILVSMFRLLVLDAFAKLRTATVSFVMSACPFVRMPAHLE